MKVAVKVALLHYRLRGGLVALATGWCPEGD